jgi:hypothetical protein
MVISGAIILSIGVLVTVAALIYVITGLSTPGGDQAMSMIFVFILLGWLFFGAAPWYLGLVLIGLGRRKQRGPVRGEVLAWILACAVYPVVTAQLSLLMGGTGNEATFLIFVISIPVLIVVSWVGAALLIWGKPKASQPAVITTAS